MKNFLAVYTGVPSGPNSKKWETMDPDTRKKKEADGIKAWGEWVQKHQKSIVEMGAPVGKTKQINGEGISDIKNAITAYTVVKAESYDEAARMFLNHPHFAIFPGDSVEIMECLPVPGMA